MNKEEIKEYIKNNLKLEVSYDVGFRRTIVLKIEDDIICKIPLGVF